MNGDYVSRACTSIHSNELQQLQRQKSGNCAQFIELVIEIQFFLHH